MAWIKIREELEGHPKLTDLMNLMQWDKDKAIGKLVVFWIWCSRYADDGDLRRHNDDRLGAAVGCCPGEDSKRFVGAMKQACWLDSDPYFRVHDWWSHFGDFLKSKYSHSSEKWCNVKRLYSRGLAGAKQSKIDREIDRKQGRGKLPPPSPLKFVQPTAEEVEEYAQTLGYAINGAAFCAHYQSKGWKIGKSPMKDWKAAVVTWKIKDGQDKPVKKPHAPSAIAAADMKAQERQSRAHEALEKAFELDLAQARASPEFKAIEAEARKRIPSNIKFGVETIMLPQTIVDVWREKLSVLG